MYLINVDFSLSDFSFSNDFNDCLLWDTDIFEIVAAEVVGIESDSISEEFCSSLNEKIQCVQLSYT